MNMLISCSCEEWASLTAPLLPLLNGAQLQKVRAPDAHSLALRLRSPGENLFLLLSADPRAPRLGQLDEQSSTLDPAPTLLSWTRATLRGRRLLALEWSPLGDPDAQGVYCRFQFSKGALILELNDTLSNLYGLDEGGIIRSWARHLPRRGLSLATQWAPPIRSISPPTAPSRVAQEVSTTMHRSLLELERFAQAALQEGTEKSARAERQRLFLRARKKLARRHQALEGDLARAEAGRDAQRLGELLKGELHRIQRGLTSITVTDWFDPALPQVDVPLDPRLDGPENLQHLFKRARRALRGEALSRQRLEETALALLELEELAEEAQERDESLEALEAKLWRAGLYRPPPQKKGKKREAPRLPYQLFLSSQGERILVGRGGRDNHLTTFQIARGRDLWLHVRDAAGAHVIVPVEREGEVHRETLLDAAALAVHHSKLRGEEKVSVRCCARKYLRAIPGAAPGRVSVSAGGKELLAVEVSERIERLYAERPPPS